MNGKKARGKKEKKKEDDLAKVAARIKQLRQKKGYSSYEYFAYDYDFSRSQFGRYEQGDNDLRITTLLRVIRALGVTPEEFFSEGFD